jgi:hypothetical protein
MLVGASIIAANFELFGLLVLLIGMALTAFVGYGALRAAGRTSAWRSVPRINDLPIFAAPRHDAGSWWSRWAFIDLFLLALLLVVILLGN